jgi:hypothetical protein
VDEPGKPVSVDAFYEVISLLDAYGARGFGCGSRESFSERDRWQAATIIYYCLPVTIRELRPARDKFVPVLRDYLDSIGLPSGERECLVLKGVSEQLIYSNPTLCAPLGLKTKRKYGISDIRALGHYRPIASQQGNRCATCGITLDFANTVELDHIVPFALIGDVSDRANWRLLCGQCNLGKHDFISSWLAPDAWNWIPPGNLGNTTNGPTLRARYAMFSTRGHCELPDCSSGPQNAQLELRRRSESGLFVPSNLAVVCSEHPAED